MLKRIMNSLRARWFVCRITSSRKSVRFGLRFSYPVYILLVVLGVLLKNPYILSFTALVAFFGVILPMHPFDYVYNFIVAKLLRVEKIPGRGSELQINSIMALLFSLGVVALTTFEVQINYLVLAIVYVLVSTFFIIILLSTDEFSTYSIYNFLLKKGSK